MSDGIIKTSELPKIIPPLPIGDTKDLKVWQDYWKQHDEKIRQDATEKVLVKILEKCNVECDTDTGQILAYQNISLDEVLDIFDSLRTKPEGT